MKTLVTESQIDTTTVIPRWRSFETNRRPTPWTACNNRSQGVIYFCCAAIALSWVTSQTSYSQEFGHTDVLFEYGEEKIEVNARTFTSFFPTRGIARQFQTLPGFASESSGGGGILPNDELVYNVLSGLEFWVDNAARPSLIEDIQIRVRNRPSHTAETVVSATTTEQPGSFNPPLNRIGRASASGEFHSDLQWFLESNDEDVEPPLGTYAMQMSITTNRAGIADSDPFYFIWHYGAETEDFNNAVAFFENQVTTPPLLGDIDGNGQLDADDAESIVAAIRDSSPDPRFDLDGDGSLGLSDLKHWVTEIAMTWQGDVNFDGEFSSNDLVSVFAAGRYESDEGATWRQGDWNADGRFGSTDLIVAFQDGGYEKGPRAAAMNTVPEPVGLQGILMCGVACVVLQKRRLGNFRSTERRAAFGGTT